MTAKILTAEQLDYLASGSEDMDLDSIWDYFDRPHGFDPVVNHSLVSFEERREGFLWTVKQLFEHGFIELNRRGGVPFPGSIDEKLDALREAFPSDDEGMEEGMWFFFPECPMGSNWKWPYQAEPIPFVPESALSSSPRGQDSSRRWLAAPGVGRVERGSTDVLAPEHMGYLLAAVRGRGLATVWGYFLHPNGYPEVPHWCESYQERIDGFCWVVRTIVEGGGHARLERREASGSEGGLDELLRELRLSFPGDERDLGDGNYFFFQTCPIVIDWDI